MSRRTPCITPHGPSRRHGVRALLLSVSLAASGCQLTAPDLRAAPNDREQAEEASPRVEAPPAPPRRKAKPRPSAPNAEEDRDEPRGPTGCPDHGQPLELIV